ncbi:MAG TPA: FG-GAP-like repeat-containing protein [Terriglobales bacterium]|nr:FG-GAP-like repeat-containing protein [Terriglobales bacterium]
MNKRTASLLVLVVFTFLSCFGIDSRNTSAANKRSARVNASAVRNSASVSVPAPPPTAIGFLSPPRAMSDGAIFGIFPAVMGDFAGNGNQDAATLVNTSPGSHVYKISAAMNDGSGNFTTVQTTAVADNIQQDPLFVGDLNKDGKDDILLVHPAVSPGHTYIQAWISNSDGTFTAKNSGVSVTTTGFVWAAVTDVNGDGILDVVVADAATPNGSIWTMLGNGDGTFQNPTSVAFTGALSAFGLGNTTSVPGNPMVFADFNGDGKLDFAAAAAPGGSAANNQIVVYLNNGAGGYTGPTLLANTNTSYDSCFLGAGNLGSATAPQEDLVSANCLDGNVTVYVNNGSGTFGTGTYYPAGARPSAVSVADVTGDGNGDVVVTDLNSAAIKVLPGNGSGAVGAATTGYVTGGAPLMPALIAHFSGASNPLGVVVPDNQANFVYLQGYGDGTFRSGINYYASPAGGGFEPEGVGLASGDFNGDGIPDFVIGNSDCLTCKHAPITVFISNADGSLKPGVNISPGGTYVLQFVAVADFDGDGKLDIAASDTLNGKVEIFYGNGDGTFGTPVPYAADSAANPHTVGIVAADINGDGKPDLAFVNNFGSTIFAPTSADVGVLINNGTNSRSGNFNTVVNTPLLSTVATELTAADVNGDKKLDLVVPLYGVCASNVCTPPGSAVAILLGNGDGTFQAESDFSLVNNGTTYLNPYDAAVGDLNGDGKVDLAVTMQDVTGATQGIAVALGNGDGTFQTPTLLQSSPQNPQFASQPLPGYVKIADMDLDGRPDLVYTNALQGTVGILYGKGDGTFYDPIDFAANRWAWDFALADVNGDGDLDVVASGFQQSFSGVGVLLNRGGATTLQSSAPNSALGTAVTFTATVHGAKLRGVPPIPTGTATFFDGSTQLGAPVALNASGVAAFTTSTLAVGTHSITAQYSGDTNYVPSTSAAVQQVVAQSAQPDYTIAATPSSVTVNPGSSASYTIKVTPTNGYNGTITLSCPTTLPTGVTCTLPSPMASPYAPATLMINTQAPTAALMKAPDMNRHHGDSNLWASLTGVGMLGMVLAGEWKKRNRRRLGVMFLILGLAMILALVGCGGGGSTAGGGGGGGGGGTPAGSYQIQVTATGTAGTNGGNTAAHPLNLITLVVN